MNFGRRYFTAAISLPLALNCSAAVLYVDLKSQAPIAPYTNWATAATVIQNAVDAASPGDEIVVTNGTYATGGKAMIGTMTNRVAVNKAVKLLSVNGPQFTLIQGYQIPGPINGDAAIRCVWLTNGVSLSGFTLTNGATQSAGDWDKFQSGAGAWCAGTDVVISNCVVVSNSASRFGGGTSHGTLYECILTGNSAAWGGGASYGVLNGCTLTTNYATVGGGACGGTLTRCTLSGNTASGAGGGASWDYFQGYAVLYNCLIAANRAYKSGGGVYIGYLQNCTITGNSAGSLGGGVTGDYAPPGGLFPPCTLYNCIVYSNTAPVGADCGIVYRLYWCCTPDSYVGQGVISSPPQFVDQAVGNLRLQSNSPCINAGINAYAAGTTDFDGNPRIVGGTVDIGAYECQSPALLDYYTWLQGYGLPTDASTVYADSDGDRMNNWQEWVCGTNPTNALSFLGMLPPSGNTNGSGVKVSWQSVGGITYYLQRSTNLAAQPAFTTVQSNIVGQAVTTSCQDTNAIGSGASFYRVGVQ